MRIYIDEDSIDTLLIKLLARDGHDVQTPDDAGLRGRNDPVPLTHAIVENRVLLSHNHRDFEELHELVKVCGGHHPGILIVRRDNNPSRDLSPHGVARAIRNIEAAGFAMFDQFQVLNHWR